MGYSASSGHGRWQVVDMRPRDVDFPLVCFDQAFKQLIANAREPIETKPGRPARRI
jgi:hypothetical protein